MIDIIIPAYNSKDTIKIALDSIASQTIVKQIKVYLVNDCSDYDYKDIVLLYKSLLYITEIDLDINMGPGHARQVGIDASSSDFIMFLDSDDMFFDLNAVEKAYNFIRNSDYDLVSTKFYEETDECLNPKINDYVWMHGKIYRRKFLEDNNIKFNDTRANEDNGFNNLIILCGAKTCYLDEPTYIWNNNPKSITRRDNYDYSFSGLSGYIYNIIWAIETAINKGKKSNKISKLAYSAFVYMYFSYFEFKEIKDFSELLKMSKKLLYYSNLYKISKTYKNQVIRDYIASNNYPDLDTDECLKNMSIDEFKKLVEEI